MSKKDHMLVLQDGSVCNDPAWSGRQAADIAQIPARTVQYWRQNEFFTPSIAVVKDGTSTPDPNHPGLREEGLVFAFPHLLGHDLSGENAQWFYGLGDAIALRLAHDLRQQKVPVDVVKHAARFFADLDWRKKYREDPSFHWIIYVPDYVLEDVDLDVPPPEEALLFYKDVDPEPKPDNVVIYDAYSAIIETMDRADQDLARRGLEPHYRPAWV